MFPFTDTISAYHKISEVSCVLAMQFLDGWVIFAEYARPRPPPGSPVNNMNSSYGSNMSLPYGRQ